MEDANVTQVVGEQWGRVEHKRITIKHVENGFIVGYTMPAKNPGEFHKTTDHTRVFLDPQGLLSFVANYFGGQVDTP